MKAQILYDQNRIDPETIKQYLNTITQITSRELRYPQVKKIAGITHQNEDVFRVKTDKKERLIYTYTNYQGARALLLLRVLDDHNYNKLKQQLQGQTIIASAELDNNNTPEEPVKKTEGISLLPSVSYNQMTLVLDDTQQQALQQKTPLLLAGVPGAGKTVLLYNLMLRAIDDNRYDVDDAAPSLFMSQSESLLTTLKTDYEHSPLEKRPAVQFSTWSQLLKTQYPELKQASVEEFAQFLKKSRLKDEPPHEVHYEFSLIAALGIDDYQKLASRQSYYSDNPSKKEELIHLFGLWQSYLAKQKLFDPMVTRLNPAKTPLFDSIFCDESQNLPPVALLDFITYAKDKRLIICLDTEQCLLSSPFIHNCIKMLLQKHYGSYNEHALSRTWRCPPNVIAVAEHLMNKKHELDSGNRRLYYHIQSAHPNGGVVSWVNTSVLEQLSQHGKSASTVVLAEQLPQHEREHINKSLATNNILTSSQAIGLDFNVVILWKPFSQNPHLWSLYQKWQKQKSGFDVSLQELNALNTLYVYITRSQGAVFFYETDKRALRFGDFLLGTLAQNKIEFSTTSDTPENEIKRWEKTIEHHLAEKRFDVARELMKFHLNMDSASIEQRINDAQQSKQENVSVLSNENSITSSSNLTPGPTAAKEVTKSTDSKTNLAQGTVENPSTPQNPQQKSAETNTKKSSDTVKKYIANLLKNPSPTNLRTLFEHKNAHAYLFEHLDEEGVCLLGQLAMTIQIDAHLIAELCLQNWQSISPGLTTELLCQINDSHQHNLLYFFSLTRGGGNLLLKLIQEKPEIALRLDTTMLSIVPGYAGVNKSLMYNLTIYSSGRQFLSEVVKLNPEHAKHFPVKTLFKVSQGKATPNLTNTSPFSWLAMSPEGCQFLINLLLTDPNLFTAMPINLLGLVQPEIFANGQSLTQNVTTFVHLSESLFGRTFLRKLFEKHPEMAKLVGVDLLFKRHPKEPQSNPATIPFTSLANCPHEGQKILEMLFKTNPAIAKAINQENFSLKNYPLNKKSKVSSPFFSLAGSDYFYPLLKTYPEIAQAVTAEELFYSYPGVGFRLSPFALLCREKGQAALSLLFDCNPKLANGASGEKLCQLQSTSLDNKTYASPLYILSLASAGIKILNKLIELNPQLAQEIPPTFLLFSHDRENPSMVQAAIYGLALLREGCKFLNALLTLNPALVKEFPPKILLSTLGDNSTTTLAQLLKRNDEGALFLARLCQYYNVNPNNLGNESVVDSSDLATETKESVTETNESATESSSLTETKASVSQLGIFANKEMTTAQEPYDSTLVDTLQT